MHEVIGNLWEFPADVRVITTNGTIKGNGECVMGRGCAAEAKAKFPQLPYLLGQHLRVHGNVPFRYGYVETSFTEDMTIGYDLVTFPVKHHWHERADPNLIRNSAEYLVAMADMRPNWQRIVLPRPGCGNGQLRWEDVQPLLSDVLDDRFYTITFR